MTQSITILGAGWLANHFITKHHKLFHPIITTSKSSPKPTHSTDHFFLDIYQQPLSFHFPPTDICLITLPFSRQLHEPMDYAQGIQRVIDQCPAYKKIIFTSSTSLYKLNNGMVNETSPVDTTPRAHALSCTEQFLLNKTSHCYILRLAGLCGGTRNSKKKCQKPVIPFGQHPVNLIHITDIVNVMYELTQPHHNKSDIINVCASEHPSKESYYRHICQTFNLTPPNFKAKEQPFKRVSNKKLIDRYNVNLVYPSPLDFKFDHV